MTKAEEMRNLALKRLNYFASHENRIEKKVYKKCLKAIKWAAKRGGQLVTITLDEDDYCSRTTPFCIHTVVEYLANDGFVVSLIGEEEGDTYHTLEVSWR